MSSQPTAEHPAPPPRQAAPPRESLTGRYRGVRAQTERLCEPLTTEDCVVQTMPDVSPTKWHLAHTTWFFETFILKEHSPSYRAFDPQYERLFNSYYNAVGPQHCRPKRGWLSRPTVQDVFAYREHVDRAMLDLLEKVSGVSDQVSGKPRAHAITDTCHLTPDTCFLIELGLQHEQQHQELILTDIKHVLASNALRAVYGGRRGDAHEAPPLDWIAHEETVAEVGAPVVEAPHGAAAFAFDNETPRHRIFLEAFEIASRLVTCGEYLAFMEDRGYERPELWLSDGWATVQREQWRAPLYWDDSDGDWSLFTLAGRRPVDPHEPVTHISFYEADAYARWAGARLATEAEWELVAHAQSIQGNFVESSHFHPVPDARFYGNCWQWTASPYAPYPRYKPLPGALGEYNAKFMCNQMVLRGGSCATPQSHIRATYRNFFPPQARWQFTGIRLARDAQ